MLMTINAVLTPSEVRQFREHLAKADWKDGKESAGSLATQVKKNQQLDEQSEVAISLGNHVLKKLGSHPQFISAALPKTIYPPKFNQYGVGETYGLHIDSAIMQVPNTNISLRSDLSATLFLSEPDEYAGGELNIETEFGAQQVKLAAGDMVLYPSSSLHQVSPVTKGVRTASFFWIQSMVSHTENRSLLYDLDQTIQTLTQQNSDQAEVTKLTGIYHNLLRQWASL
jgi:PKHD-type hydroxylase